MEKWDILNAQGDPTGVTAVRGKTVLKTGDYHLVVHIWVLDDKGNFLIQRRSDTKKLMPGEWAATGGSAICGESSFCAAQRELMEELGITPAPRRFSNKLRLRRRNSFVDLWFYKSNISAEDVRVQPSEVAEVKWVNEKELKQMVENGEFHNYGEDYFSNVFRCAKEYLYEYEA